MNFVKIVGVTCLMIGLTKSTFIRRQNASNIQKAGIGVCCPIIARHTNEERSEYKYCSRKRNRGQEKTLTTLIKGFDVA